MIRQFLLSMLILSTFAGCSILMNNGEFSDRERDLRAGNVPSSMHQEWAEADRCTKCHMIWSWEHGYYSNWDRYGFISDYWKSSPYAYKDPYRLGAQNNSLIEFYFTDWWNGPWLDSQPDMNPPMRLDGYERVNDGTAQPDDFEGKVIIVDQSGKGDARSIQEGVDLAGPGAIVFVRPGTYHESVRLTHGICLWGQDAHTTIIDPDLTDHAIIAANNCDISGFTFTGTGMNYKDYTFSAGVYTLDCDSTLVVRGNIFDSNAVYGVLVESSRIGGTPVDPWERYISMDNALDNIQYTSMPNPRIIGNTFYMIGERAVYAIHAAPEVVNNVFIGNVKTVGMTQHSRPYIHHNVFYRNNVTINANRSMPVVCNNIMLDNYWGQRIVEGSRPYFHDNITWNSPYYKEFAENGERIAYKPLPGNGEYSIAPGFVDPDGGDFLLKQDSPLSQMMSQDMVYGLIEARGVQLPPVFACKRSYAEEFNNRSVQNDEIVAAVMQRNERINNISATYEISYRSYLDVAYTPDGDQVFPRISKEPVDGIDYQVSRWIMSGEKRYKQYSATIYEGARAVSDSGTIVFDGKQIHALSGRYTDICRTYDDPDEVGEHVFRENPGGLYLDYDQYLNGAIGAGGTFFFGYLKILGGKFSDDRVTVNGHECIVVEYPHLGTDQIFRFYLDPEICYLPRRIDHYFERELYRRIDGYEYRTIDGISVPVRAVITDFVVKGELTGSVAGVCTMQANDIVINDESIVFPSVALQE